MTDPSQDDRLRRAFSASSSPAEPGPGCASDEEIWRASRGELGARRARELLRHSLDCAACAQSWEAAAALQREAAGESQVVPIDRRRRQILYGLAAAAAVLLPLLALALLLDRGPQAPAGGAHGRPSPMAATVHAELWRVGAAENEVLTQGGEVRPGDRIYLTLRSDEPVHLYVVNRDETGEATALFPVDGAQWTNPLPAGATRRVPGETGWAYDSWEVSSAGGQESFVVVASAAPVREMESAIALMGQASPIDPGGVVRGGEPDPGDPGQAADALRTALEQLAAHASPDVMVQEIKLRNPR